MPSMGLRPLTAIWLVAIGGGIGSALRYYSYIVLGARPLTTFSVNIIGSFLIGMLAATTSNVPARVFLGTGILGGFTTFSAWQLEAFSASQSKAGVAASLTILFGSLAVGYAACWSGYALGHRLWK
jgi:fluoride exporter